MTNWGGTMPSNDLLSVKKVINSLVNDKISKINYLALYIVTEVQEETFTCNIKHLNLINMQYEEVPVMTLGGGNLKAGIMKLPNVDDLVIVGFLGKKNQDFPVILGTIFDSVSAQPDNIPQIKTNEVLISNKKQGAYIYINQDNQITLNPFTETAKINFYKKYSFPTEDGVSGQSLQSGGDGQLYWGYSDYSNLVTNISNVRLANDSTEELATLVVTDEGEVIGLDLR